MNKSISNIIRKIGHRIYNIGNKYSIADNSPVTADMQEKEFLEIYQLCKPFTMTTIERMYALYCAVNYVLLSNIRGDFVECGVWRGGSSMLIAKMLQNRKIKERKIYLYDTFEGMTEPTMEDIDIHGETALTLLEEYKDHKETSVWCFASLEDVKKNMQITNFKTENIVYVKGKVEETIPHIMPEENIALLRLDTDWYESTKHELTFLFPRLEINGVLIIDDYGHWEGCKKAVDEYREKNGISLLLNRIDYTGRIGIKTAIKNEG
ncbi:MAG: class I SAM-dependent methyltransferase [Ignavibacteriae bacterium]|nr:class I SAM-dependent methyltransferase [Ignavibacteriota bacterium]